ncbi:MAG: hypothetical protein JW384_00040 [Nitrosomonadaceae bacterium]|nr:hypothetical protein [Nitrosomonadaceae bacterium]
MKERIIPETRPDFMASRWLSLGGVKPVPGDPETSAQFTATHTCLTTITNYLIYVAGPWFTVTPEEIADAHREFIEWSERYNQTSRETGEGLLTTDISLHHLLALSTRRLNALEEFGGEGREEYPLFLHFHNMIRLTAS